MAVSESVLALLQSTGQARALEAVDAGLAVSCEPNPPPRSRAAPP